MKVKFNLLQTDKAKSRLFLPMKLFNSYIILTILINFFGPWHYQGYNNKLLVLIFMIIFLFCFTLAFYIGIGKSIKQSNVIAPKIGTSKKITIIKVFIVVALFIYCNLLIDSFLRFGIFSGNSINEIMALAYNRSHSTEWTGINWAEWVYSYAYIFCFVSMTLGLYWFRQLSSFYKLLLISVFTSSFAYTILFVGAQKNIGDIIIIVGSVALIKFARFGSKIKARNLLILITIIISIIIFFSTAFLARISLWGISGTSTWGMAYLDINHWMLRYLPSYLAVGFGILMYYISHGYYGLSLCLNLPFVWTKGLGSSFTIRDIFGRYLNTEPLVSGLTYPERMEATTGWPAYANWHTIFPWLASDFTFLGAILLIAFVTYIYAISWKEAVIEENPLSILNFSFLSILFIYVPANNQLFQTKTSLFAFTVVTILWVFNHIKGGKKGFPQGIK